MTLTRNGELRGCIGFIEPVLPLGQAVIRTAVYAATGDPRFPPRRRGRARGHPLRDLRPDAGPAGRRPQEDQGRHARPDRRKGRAARRAPAAGPGRERLGPSDIPRPGLPQGRPARRDAWRRGAKLSVFEAIIFHE
ncbi:MAG: AMMECR1 domain-containing protein [Anaerotruncus sp.]|nr:AMMECR1 domain-containing protein [Anaerotruncus sp.]